MEKRYVPAFDTSHGSVIVEPETNLNVSERVMNIGSVLPSVCNAAEAENKKKIIHLIFH